MKTNYVIAFAVFVCTAGIVNAKQQPRNPFKHSPYHHTNSPYAKKVTPSLPQRTLEFYWDDALADWNDMPDSIYTVYNSNGDPIRETRVHNYNGAYSAISYIYNPAHQLIAEYYMDQNGQQWDTSSKSTYEYDSHGLQTLYTSYSQMSGEWEIQYSYKTLNTYDTNGQLIEDMTQTWDETEYINESKTIYVYDVNGKLNGAAFLQWNTGTSAFDSSARIHNLVWYKWATNIEDGLIQSYDIQEWNGSMFEQSGRVSTVYDSHDNVTDEKEESWVDNTWEVDYQEKYILTYNANNDLTQMISQNLDDDNSLVNYKKSLYDDFVQFTGLIQLTKQSTPLTIYPNPFEGAATIEIPSYSNSGEMVLAVFDLLGRSVLIQPIDGPKTIFEKGNLQQGLYTFQLLEKNAVTHTGKFIIK